MHEDYDENYEDDEYDYGDSQDDPESQYKKYFKFDPEAWDAWGKMLYDALNDIVEYPSNVWYISPKTGFFGSNKDMSFPVNSYFSNTGNGYAFQYLGNNYQGSQIWKKKYFVFNPIDIEYRQHIQAHSIHFLHQPHYYKGLFDILN
jgi:hypothetical protein